jgi:hypothetical protein
VFCRGRTSILDLSLIRRRHPNMTRVPLILEPADFRSRDKDRMKSARRKLSRRPPVGRALVAMFILFGSCDQGPAHVRGAETMKQTAMVAGPGEPTFAERYRVTVTLPMPERDFIALLRRLNLHFEVCGGWSTSHPLPPPRWRSSVDLTSAVKCYDVVGDVDPVHHTGESFRAFLDNHGQVIYIENTFSYTGP